LLRRPRKPLWEFKAERIGGPGILGIDGRDVRWDPSALDWIEAWFKRGRRGRPRADYHQEWAQRFQQLYAEALEEFEFNRVDGEAKPSKIDICFEIAVDDFAAHPERWRCNPAGRPRKDAGRTVWKAVKPLI
jgi:hypothetical protein